MKYKIREIENLLKKALDNFSVVILTGARQTGKSTLLKNVLKDYKYYTLDDPFIHQQAIEDPLSIINLNNLPIIIDEIQYAPELLRYIKLLVDSDRQMKGQIVLTGSQKFNMMKDLSETLAGRAAILNLPVFSINECGAKKIDQRKECFDMIFNGFYPEQVLARNHEIALFYSSYIQTYIERDVRQIINVGDLALFRKYISILAANSASLLNLNEISNICGIANNTAKKWLSVMETSGIIFLLQPHFSNIPKRLIKSPKIFFCDTGILTYLLRYPNADVLAAGPAAGSFFENFIISEVYKYKQNRNALFEIYFFRDSNGLETDLIIEYGGKFLLFEIKLSETIRMEHFKNLKRILPYFQDCKAFILGFFKQEHTTSDNIMVTNWINLYNILDAHFSN